MTATKTKPARRFVPDQSAVRLGDSVRVHAGTLIHRRATTRTARYAPACGAGRRTYADGSRRVSAGTATDQRITCRNCEKRQPQAVEAIHAAQDLADRDNEQRITGHLREMVAGLAATIYGDWPSDHMTCWEADAVALVLLAGGQRDAAQAVIASHADSDEESSDTHHVPKGLTARQVARQHIRTLIACHANGNPLHQRDTSDRTGMTFTVEGHETDSSNNGWVYTLHADDEDQALKTAQGFHFGESVGQDEDRDRYTWSVTAGGPENHWGYINDLRLSTCRNR